MVVVMQSDRDTEALSADEQNLLPRLSNSPSAGKTTALEQGLEIPEGWKPTADKPVPVVRCHYIFKEGHEKAGDRCGRWSIRGHTHCSKHSGSLPNVKKKADAIVESARMRLMNMADDAVDVFEELLQPGTSEAIRLKAAENILNRAGIKDAPDLSVEVTHTVAPSELLHERLKGIAERVNPPEEEDEITVEVEEENEDVSYNNNDLPPEA